MNSGLRSAALAVIVFIAAGRSAHAAIVVGLVLDPTTTAGSSPDVNSIYSGLGTWHLFAVDDNADDFGISSYNIDLTGATAIRHTSPSACGIADVNGDFHAAGFDLLRSANGSTGSSSIQASQPLPDQSPFLIAGLGQQAGSFASATGGGSSSGTTSPSWGDYNTISPLNGKNWVFLAEGKYDQGVLPSIAQASFTVFNNRATFGSSLSSTAIVPEPITPTLLTPEYLAHLTAPPPSSLPASVAELEPQPVVVPAPPINMPPNALPGPPDSPVAINEPQPDVEPTGVPPLPYDPVSPDGNWVRLSIWEGVTGVDHDGLIYFTYQPIDSAVTLMPYDVAIKRPHGLQAAMITAFTGLVSYDNFANDGFNYSAAVPSLELASFNALGMRSTVSASLESAVAAPEPATLALVGLATIGLGGMVHRHRGTATI